MKTNQYKCLDLNEWTTPTKEELEVWKDVAGYEGLYQVSNMGRVKFLKFGNERILNPRRQTKGYLQVNLCKNGEVKTYTVHRLVAKTFLLNPNNLPQVNHKDEDKTNNSVENLEWCDAKYNCNYGTRTQRCSKPVLQYTIDGEFIGEWKSQTDVQRTLGYNQGYISSCCNGKCKSAYGFVWKNKNS